MEKKTIPAKPCYSHLGGKLGNLLLASFLEKKWIVATGEKQYVVSEKGKRSLKSWG